MTLAEFNKQIAEATGDASPEDVHVDFFCQEPITLRLVADQQGKLWIEAV